MSLPSLVASAACELETELITVAACGVQELDIAIVKATTSQFHVQPKEKHVRSKHTLQVSLWP